MNALGRILPLALIGSTAAVILVLVTSAQPDSHQMVLKQYVTRGSF